MSSEVSTRHSIDTSSPDDLSRSRIQSDSESEEEVPSPKSKRKKGETKGKKSPEKKSYRCDRCNFSSCSKAKYTKHAKSAHSGTVVQCDHCEFKTPYKWNLDRHYKNHMGGGALCCHLCNFSCDIKQSLTVHLQNHHTNVPEEIIESVKRQQIPSRNQRAKDDAVNNNSSTSTPANGNPPPAVGSNSTNNTSSSVENGRASPETLAEKKVPPLRISRSLTGLSLGEENNSSSCGKKEEESAAGAGSSVEEAQNAPISSAGNASCNELTFSDEKRNVKKCEQCDFETCADGSSAVMKQHVASQHGAHRTTKYHHQHKRTRGASSSPEYSDKPSPSSSPSLPVTPIPLPPKKSKGSTSPRPGQPASSCSGNGSGSAIHRSQSPLKASEAINAYGSNDHNLHAAGPLDGHHHSSHHQSILNSVHSHSQLQSSGEESAFTPVGGNDYSHAQLSSLKKPKQRALAQFYQKLKTKFSTAADDNDGSGFPVDGDGTETAKEDASDDSQKNNSMSSKSNRCQYCRQRCKSSADLASHLEKCADAQGKREGVKEGGHEDKNLMTTKADLKVKVEKEGFQVATSWSNSGSRGADSDDNEIDTKAQPLNGSAGETSDDLIGFETAPGVGAIHSGKMDEMEYQGYQQKEGNGRQEEGSENRTNEPEEEEEEEIEENTVGRKPGGKNSKATITSRKVYRCPESDCSFWATTASRFHVHIVGHYNLKPFECSECHYKSNWRWDVNKHIRLKTPKDPKHAIAKTLLTHESGQRDYRKYDNYLVAMSLTHSANAKAPDCSTAASKRTRNVVASPKGSPELKHQSVSNTTTASRTASPTNNGGSVNSTAVTLSGSASSGTSSGKQKSPKLTKTPASSASSTQSNAESSGVEECTSAYSIHQQHGSTQSQQLQQEDTSSYPVDLASPSNSSSEGRTFVETRMLAGGEIYQTSLLKPDLDMNTNNNEGDHEEAEDTPPSGFDLTLKRPRSRHRQQKKSQDEERQSQATYTMFFHDMKTQQQAAMPPMPTKKSRLQQSEQQQTTSCTAGGATSGTENKILSMWQCIKCDFKHLNKDVVSTHIREQHKPKKGDPVSLLTHNHLIQVMIPEQDVDVLMASNSGDGADYSARGLLSGVNKEIYQQTYFENGKVLSCKFCPFTTGLLYEMEIHADHHLNKSNSHFSCPYCSYSVAVKSELQEHVKLHGEVALQQPEIQNKLINSSTMLTSACDPSKLSLLSPTVTAENLNLSKKDKKYYCTECPYATQDGREFQYHKQCHEPADHPFKCHRCTFNVSVKFHLLEHLRVHGIQIEEVGNPYATPQSDYGYPPNEYDNMRGGSPTERTQDEPLNLSIFANRKPVVIWDSNGIPVEGYRCAVCPQIFQDLNDLKEHEYVTNHRDNGNNNGNSCNAGRQCDSPPAEAMNLCTKPVDHSNKKSSQNNSKVNNNANSNSSKRSTVVPLPHCSPISPPLPLTSAAVDQGSGTGTATKGEKEYLYLCDICPARFFLEQELKIHYTFHENKSTFSCSKCSYSARHKDPHLMSHMKVHGAAYQEKTKSLLTRFPRAKVNLGSSTSVAAAAALSAASLLNPSILNPNFNFQTAAAALSSAVGKLKPGNCASSSFPDSNNLDALRKNGLSLACPKCPENFYTTSAFQQHIDLHCNGRPPTTDYRCRFCDYCAESRKGLMVHEMVHTGTDITIDSSTAAAVLAAGKLLPSAGAFNPVSMMAMIAHQESPFGASAAISAANLCSTGDADHNEKTSVTVPEEAYEGNPDFSYPTYMKNGRVKSKRYKCMKCPSAFEKKDQYHTHIGLHGSNQKYKCTVCDYAVTYYANYIQHLKKHENQRNIPTDLLNLGRKRHQDEDGNGSLLKVPKVVENGENSSTGSVSGASVGSVDSNENHNSSLLKCCYCPFHCFDEATLDTHLIHHQDNPNWLHVCHICTFRTSSKKSLKEHSKVHLSNTYQHWQNGGEQEKHVNGGLVASKKREYLNGFGDNGHTKSHQYQKGNGHDDSSNGSL